MTHLIIGQVGMKPPKIALSSSGEKKRERFYVLIFHLDFLILIKAFLRYLAVIELHLLSIKSTSFSDTVCA